jgi:hypothetical protein
MSMARCRFPVSEMKPSRSIRSRRPGPGTEPSPGVSVRVLRPAGHCGHARPAAAPPCSGPRSRGTVADCDGQPRQHRGELDAWRGPRMGPAPGGTTTALLQLSVAGHAFACHRRFEAGGLGYGRRPHSRFSRAVHEETLLTERRLKTKHGAPRARAGARAPGRLPSAHTVAHSPQRTSTKRASRTPPAPSFHASPHTHSATDR